MWLCYERRINKDILQTTHWELVHNAFYNMGLNTSLYYFVLYFNMYIDWRWWLLKYSAHTYTCLCLMSNIGEKCWWIIIIIYYCLDTKHNTIFSQFLLPLHFWLHHFYCFYIAWFWTFMTTCTIKHLFSIDFECLAHPNEFPFTDLHVLVHEVRETHSFISC